MKRLLATVALAIPLFCSAVQFDSTAHFQVGTRYPEETSFMKFTGNFYDFLPNTNHMWIITPKVYLHPGNPADFSVAVGTKHSLGPVVVGHHVFAHCHNLGDFPVNQYGHTLELSHKFWDAKVNYYHPANGVYPLSAGVNSAARIDGEMTMKINNGSFTLGPVYEFSEKPWGFISRVTAVLEKVDIGIELYKPPGGEVMTALFTTFKFPNKAVPRLAARGDTSCHYTNLSIDGPISANGEKPEKVKRFPIADAKSK